MKLDSKQDHNVLYQTCVFPGRSENQDGRHSLWFTETFSTSLLQLNSMKLDKFQCMEHLRLWRVWHAIREILPFRTPSLSRPFWDLHMFYCWDNFFQTFRVFSPLFDFECPSVNYFSRFRSIRYERLSKTCSKLPNFIFLFLKTWHIVTS